MIEFPEAFVLAEQLNDTIYGKRITNVVTGYSPHKFAWFYGDPENYHNLLTDKTIGKATGYGGLVEIKAEEMVILFGDGVGLRFQSENEKYPAKHQLLLEFNDSSALSASVQMYGGLWCFKEGDFDNPYYKVAKEKPSPLSNEFNQEYFKQLINSPAVQKLSAKALLATEQRIPGLGNGVLQDILNNAKVHPKQKISTLSDPDKDNLYYAIKSTLAEMIALGGRDTERDLFGCLGGYQTKLSKKTVNKPCPVCGSIIKKETYMGGSIYYCGGCQRV